MRNFLSGILGVLCILAIHGCTDKEPATEREPKDTIFQGQIDALEKAEDVNRIIEIHSTQQREAIDKLKSVNKNRQ